MKALFTLALILSTTYIVRSQVLYEENFESYTLGLILEQTSFDVVEGSNNSFQIIQNENGRHLRINSPGSLYKNLNLWSSRNSGNDVLQVEFDYFTGAVSENLSRGGIAIYGGHDELIGIMMHNDSKVVFGAYHYWGVLLMERELGNGDSSVVLPPNTWLRMAFSYNTITKEAIFKGPGFSKTFANYFNWNYDSYSFQYLHLDEPAYFYYDNIVAKAVPSSTLAIDQPFQVEAGLQLHPNPATDYVMVETKDTILAVYIYDVYGKRSDAIFNNGKIDVSQFPTGNYIIGLKTDKGFVSQKIIKK